MAQIMAATGMPCGHRRRSHPADFIQKAQRAQQVAQDQGMAYLKCLSACPLNWGDKPNTERKVIAAAVESCYFPLYEVVDGVTRLSYDPATSASRWRSSWARWAATKHLTQPGTRPSPSASSRRWTAATSASRPGRSTRCCDGSAHPAAKAKGR